MQGAPDPDWYFDHFRYEGRDSGRVVPGPAAQWRLWWRVAARELVRSRPELAPACRQGFILRTAELADLGVSRKQARTLVRKATWSTSAPGTLAVLDPRLSVDGTPSDRWSIERRRHALACAAAIARNPGFRVSGESAAVLSGLPTIEVPSRPQLTAPLELATHRRGQAAVEADEVSYWYGIPLLSPARTVVDVARRDRRGGLVLADAALHEGLVDADGLARALERAGGWCGIRQARDIVALADGRAESPLESLTRLALHDDDFPAPQLQVEITVPGHREPYRVDLYWRDRRVILECDGRVKYAADEGWREKRRELALRQVDGNHVARVSWADVVHDWPQTAAYLRTVLGLPIAG